MVAEVKESIAREQCKSYRDPTVDFVSGVCIMLVVFGHIPRYLTSAAAVTGFIEWLYTFHVPVFVLPSGWFTYGR